MDGRRFDDLTRGLSREQRPSRRRLLTGLAALAASTLGPAAGRRPASAQPAPPDFSGTRCAGPANLPCPPGYGCAQPRMVGAYGFCFRLSTQAPEPAPEPAPTPCAAVRCAAGYACCDANGSASCLPAGVACPTFPPVPGPAPEPHPCAAILCPPGTLCCPNCGGLCLPPETPCSAAACQNS